VVACIGPQVRKKRVGREAPADGSIPQYASGFNKVVPIYSADRLTIPCQFWIEANLCNIMEATKSKRFVLRLFSVNPVPLCFNDFTAY